MNGDPPRPPAFDADGVELRSRTYQWVEPDALGAARSYRTGLEGLEAIRDGRAAGAPVMYTIGWRMTEVTAGSVTLVLEPQPYHLNPYRVHGGVLTALLDSATACAVISVLEPGQGSSTLEIKVNYLRPVFVGTGTITCTATVVHRSRQIVIADGAITDGSGRPLARGSATSLIAPVDSQP